MGLFLAANGLPLHDAQPDLDVPMVERIAAGQVNHEAIVAWLSGRTT
jgi:prophage maintenance system killer protein